MALSGSRAWTRPTAASFDAFARIRRILVRTYPTLRESGLEDIDPSLLPRPSFRPEVRPSKKGRHFDRPDELASPRGPFCRVHPICPVGPDYPVGPGYPVGIGRQAGLIGKRAFRA